VADVKFFNSPNPDVWQAKAGDHRVAVSGRLTNKLAFYCDCPDFWVHWPEDYQCKHVAAALEAIIVKVEATK
jgi:SWIM zinc finger